MREVSTLQNSGRDVVTISAQMMLADGKIVAEEEAILDSLAKKFGYSKSDLSMAIKRVEVRRLGQKRQKEAAQ